MPAVLQFLNCAHDRGPCLLMSYYESAGKGETTVKKNIVFVHGAWLTSQSWENFIGYFEKKGYTWSAPEWPLRDKSVAELRENTPPELAEIGVKELTDHYEGIIRKLPEP